MAAARPVPAASVEEACDELLPTDTKVRRDFRQDAGERADPQCIVPRDRDVVLAMLGRRQAHVAASLTRDPITKTSESLSE